MNSDPVVNPALDGSWVRIPNVAGHDTGQRPLSTPNGDSGSEAPILIFGLQKRLVCPTY
jgi:hypothetical protein